MPKLQLSRPDGTQVDHELTGEVVTIGRAPDNIFHIDDVSISSHHATVSPSGDGYLLKDLGSTNGTMVNGQALEAETEYAMKAGDKIRFGKVDAIFDPENAEAGAQELPGNDDRVVKAATKSIKPSNFMNASPFQKLKVKKDTVGIVALGMGVVALLATLAVLWMAMQMPPP
jgi:pSer/pThr/pTyr-binding forkhead associated (FHA) protein